MSTGGYQASERLDGSGLRVAVVCTRWNERTVGALLKGARRGLKQCAVKPSRVTVVWVPGAFEIPLAARTLAATEQYDLVITLGAVIRGDTPHFEYVSGPCADGLMRAQLDTGVPIMFGVLTVNNQAQADERCAPGDTNKGYEAALGGVEMALLINSLR